MNNRDIEAKLGRAFEELCPDDFGKILSAARSQERTVIPMTEIREKKKNTGMLRRGLGIAAAVVIVAGCLLGFGAYQRSYAVASTVALEVNPSLEINVNRAEKVLDVIPKNDDAVKVIGDMDFKGSKLDVTVNALIGSMLRNGYISELANSILISVDGKDAARSAALQDKLTQEVNDLLKAGGSGGAVLSQTLAEDDYVRELSNTYGITAGKAQLIEAIVNQDPRYAAEDLAGLSINELSLLLNSRNLTPENVQIEGSASDGAYIGGKAAESAALADAGVEAADTDFLRTGMDFEHGRMVYEVEFNAAGMEYEYEVDALTGEITNRESERSDDFIPNSGVSAPNAAKPQSGQGGAAPQNPTAGGASGAYITEADAKAAALEHAGLTEADTDYITAKLDRDDGLQVYEVEFRCGADEYDYKIDAASGKVLDYDYDYERSFAPTQEALSAGSGITEADAKAAALEHAGLTEADTDYITAKLDRDDGLQVYEIEFRCGREEYEYTIEAASGKILDYDRDYDD